VRRLLMLRLRERTLLDNTHLIVVQTVHSQGFSGSAGLASMKVDTAPGVVAYSTVRGGILTRGRRSRSYWTECPRDGGT
jgi:hypothetical protein